LPPTEPMAPRSRGAAPKAGLPKPKRRTKERTLPSPAKVEARRRPPAASAGRTMLPPARRPKSGIFESLPGDLDWPRKRASRPPGPENAPPPAAGPEPQRQGYRRWLDRLIADEHDGGPEPDSGTG
ncbi:MAG TPA: hypothetical protein VNM87_11475, partial [Candidatus Udaeobacter sp.]|nr:hypothetical protein [Candidatus Udaeobacter sp.]